MKVIFPTCDDCKKTCQPTQIFRLVWKQKNLTADLCPSCLVKHQKKSIKDLNITKEQMIKSGYWEQGAREVDFKSYLEKWVQRQKSLAG